MTDRLPSRDGAAEALHGLLAISMADELPKLNLVADIETIQSQLAKRQPNPSILKASWETVKTAATIDGCLRFVHRATELITPLLTVLAPYSGT